MSISIIIYFGLLILFVIISFGCLGAKRKSLLATITFSAVAACVIGSLGMGLWVGLHDNWKQTQKVIQTGDVRPDSLRYLTQENSAVEVIETKNPKITSERIRVDMENNDLKFPWSISINQSYILRLHLNHENKKTLENYLKK